MIARQNDVSRQPVPGRYGNVARAGEIVKIEPLAEIRSEIGLT